MRSAATFRSAPGAEVARTPLARAWRAALPALLLLCPAAGLPAQEDPADRMPARPGAWQGEWTLTRDHPALRTLAGSRLLELAIHHAEGAAEAHVWWRTGPAICPEPLADEPCEWMGAHGGPTPAALVEGRLVMVLPVSADAEDPFVLLLDPPSRPGASRGALVGARGGVAWPLDARRDP